MYSSYKVIERPNSKFSLYSVRTSIARMKKKYRGIQKKGTRWVDW